MADIESDQQPQSVGVVADTVGALGSYSNSAVTMLRPENLFRPPRTNRYWPPKYRAPCCRGLSTSLATPRLLIWMRRAIL
jgi:hypothetical protein